MAFTVETGDGLDTANAFLSVLEFKAYWVDRGNALAGVTDGTIESAIVKATDYIDRHFSGRFRGVRLTETQALSWPREGTYQDGRVMDPMPPELLAATAEYGFRAMSGDLAPDLAYSDSNALVKEHEERVGPILERTAYGMNGIISSFRAYPMADATLAPLLIGGGKGYLLRV